jgi:hypothetical protein
MCTPVSGGYPLVDPDDYRPQDAHADVAGEPTHTPKETLSNCDESSESSSDVPYIRTPDIVPFGQQAHTPRPARHAKESCLLS